MKYPAVLPVIAVILSVLIGTGQAVAEQRVALVIGNAAYRAAPLVNPTNDAADMAGVLRETDFTVDVLINATRKEMLEAVRQFGEKIKNGGVGLFFYAGHGLQVKGENYLVPVDAAMTNEDEVEDYCVKASSVLRKMETANNRLNIIVLDACRNNPFVRTRGGGQGLARMDAPSGSILAYATAPGAVASDGGGANGLYTSKILKNMKTPGLEIGKLFRRVRVEVMEESKKAQVPWESSSLTGEFYFVPAGPARIAAQEAGQGQAKVMSGTQKDPRDLVFDSGGQAQDGVKVSSLEKKKPSPASRSAPKRLAILYFDNSSGKQELDALKKGLADMLITDLSKIKLLRIVEREKIEEILKEQKLQATTAIDPATAVKIGQLAGAQVILVGGYFEMFGQLRLDARLIEVETGQVLKAEGLNGKSQDFFQLKDRLVWLIAQNLDLDLDRPGESTPGQKNAFAHLLVYSRALDCLDGGDKDQAVKLLTEILEAQPDFGPARTLLTKIKS